MQPSVYNCTKIGHDHGYISAYVSKIFITAFLQNISGRLLINFPRLKYTSILVIFYTVVSECVFISRTVGRKVIMKLLCPTTQAWDVSHSGRTVTCWWKEPRKTNDGGLSTRPKCQSCVPKINLLPLTCRSYLIPHHPSEKVQNLAI